MTITVERNGDFVYKKKPFKCYYFTVIWYKLFNNNENYSREYIYIYILLLKK